MTGARHQKWVTFSQVFSSQIFIQVPNKFELRGYAVTQLRVWYCINKYTHEKFSTV